MLEEQHDCHSGQEFRTGGKCFFTKIYNSEYDKLTRFSFQIVQDSMEAEDIAAETLTKLSKILKNFDSDKGILAFLYTTARNASYNFVKQRNIHNAVKLKIDRVSINEAELGAEELNKAKLIATIHEEITKLPEKERLVLQLFYIEGLNYQQISERTGVQNFETLRSTKSRGLSHLRRILSEKQIA